MPRLDSVQVCVDLERLGEVAAMGSLHRLDARTGEIVSFEYERSWIERADAFSFDPELALVAGSQYPGRGRSAFGIFLDSSPDRWGRVLMQRRENTRARREGRRPRTLTPVKGLSLNTTVSRSGWGVKSQAVIRLPASARNWRRGAP